MKINKKSYEDILIKAAKAFVLAAYPKVPVETGMSRGSFLKLARKLKISIPIVPKRHKTVTKRYKTKTGTIEKQYVVNVAKKRYYFSDGRSIPKNKESGSRLSDYEIVANSKRIRFMFQTKVFQYNLLDTNTTGLPQGYLPWQSFKAGKEAFDAVLDEFIPPDLEKYITQTRISVGFGARGVVSTELPKRTQKTRYGN